MIVVVADTCAVLAANTPSHPDRYSTASALERAGTVVISPLVLCEIDHLARRINPISRGQIVDGITEDARRGRVIIPEVTPEVLTDARGVVHRYRDLDLSDAVSVALAAVYRTDAVLTLDHRDFRSIRPLSSHKAFRILPADL